MEMYIRCIIATIGVLWVLVLALFVCIYYLSLSIEDYNAKTEILKSHVTERIAHNFANIRKDMTDSLTRLDSVCLRVEGENRKALQEIEEKIESISRIKREDVDVRKPKGSRNGTGTDK